MGDSDNCLLPDTINLSYIKIVCTNYIYIMCMYIYVYVYECVCMCIVYCLYMCVCVCVCVWFANLQTGELSSDEI